MGGGLREVKTTYYGSFVYALDPTTSGRQVLNVFAQDEITLTDRLALTLGSKFEHQTTSGWAIEPTARLLASLDARQRIWAAVSHVHRTPSLSELYQQINYAAFIGANRVPIVLGMTGNPAFKVEELTESEAGYRIDLGADASIDVAVFRGAYGGLATNEPMAPVFEATPSPHLFIGTTYANLLDATTTGLEVAGHWAPSGTWRLDGSYSGLRVAPKVDPSSRDAQAPLFDGTAPTHQWQLHTSVWLGSRVQLDGGIYHVGALRVMRVPAYTRADARTEVKITPQVSLVVVGQNLTDRAHAELATFDGVTATLIPRSVSASFVWRR